jgi:hypothetical protein
MKSVVNQKLANRNAKIGQYTNLAAIVIMVVGLFVGLRAQAYIGLWFIAILVGFILLQVSTYFTNRWGRNPRPHDLLDKNLKGLGKEFVIYHYIAPASHLLVSPAGVWALLPYYQSGSVAFEKNRWRARGGGFMQAYMRIFGADSIGRPDLEANAEIQAMERYFKRLLPEGTSPPEVMAVLVFVNPKLQLQTNDANLPALLVKDLKDFLRQRTKEKPISTTMVQMIQNVLPQPENE